MIDGSDDVPGDGDEPPVGVHNFEDFGNVGAGRSAAAGARDSSQLKLVAMPDALFFAAVDDEIRAVGQ